MVMPTAGLFDSDKVTYTQDSVLGRNPNAVPSLNATPEGPFPHLMADDGNGDYGGKVEGSGFSGGANGITFYFK